MPEFSSHDTRVQRPPPCCLLLGGQRLAMADHEGAVKNVPAELGVSIAALQVIDAIDQVGVNSELEEVGLADDASGILGEISALNIRKKI